MSDGEAAVQAEQRGVPSHWRVLGRALLLAGGVCLLGAAVGFFRTPRTYRSTALVTFTPWSGTAAGAPAFLASQARLAGSRRVVDLAMAGPDWSAAWPRGPAAGAGYAKTLSAQVQPGGGIRMAYEDPDPAAAQGRLLAFVNAYRQEERESEADLHAKRVQLLSQLLEEAPDDPRKQAIASKLASMKATPPAEPTRLVLPPAPAALVPARHWRDAGWGAGIAGLLFVVIRGRSVWRAWRVARVVAAGRTAFPVVMGEVTPRPVVPVGDGEAAGAPEACPRSSTMSTGE